MDTKGTEDVNQQMGIDRRCDPGTAVAIGIGGVVALIITIVKILSQI